MELDYWTVTAKISSEKQAQYFGKFGAMRPYLFIIIDASQVVDDNFIKNIITSSFSDIVVNNVKYRKYFNLDMNETFEFQYARMYFDDLSSTCRYGKFRKINVD